MAGYDFVVYLSLLCSIVFLSLSIVSIFLCFPIVSYVVLFLICLPLCAPSLLIFQLVLTFTGWVPTYWAPQVHPNYGSGDCDFAPPKNGLISVAGCSWYRNVKNTVWNAHLICHLRPGEVYESTGACTLASTL